MPNVTQPPDSDPPPPPPPYFAVLPRPHWPLIDAVAARLGLPPAA